MPPTDDLGRRISGIAALDQPIRRDLYEFLTGAGDWRSRDDAAEALDIPRSVAAFHLDKLTDAGVVEVRYERTSGRTGPGAGRPSKLYRPSGDTVSASVPARQYDLAASILATAIEVSRRDDEPVADVLSQIARERGRQIGKSLEANLASEAGTITRRDALLDRLTAHGYEPIDGDDRIGGGDISLANCPFHRLAQEHRVLVCGLNLDLLDGVLDGPSRADGWTATLAPTPQHCCVRLTHGEPDPNSIGSMATDRSPDTVTEAIQMLQSEGYSNNFRIVNSKLVCDQQEFCHVGDVVVERVFRFEGASDPGDEMIVFGLRDPETGQSGIIASAFGIHADPEVFDHLIGMQRRFDG